MRNKTSFWKRSLAALLSFVMVLGMFPVLGMAPAAQAAEDQAVESQAAEGQQTNITGDYITLPITIRDFAADGMLFEYNEVNRGTFTRNEDGTLTWNDPNTYTKTDRLYSLTNAAYTATYNPNYWNLDSTTGAWSEGGDYTGIRIYPASADIFKSTDYTKTSGINWYCFIVDSSGNILRVLDLAADKTDIATIMTEVGGAYSVWAWRDASNLPAYNLISKVTEDNKGLYRFSFNTSTTAGATVNVYLGLCYYENTNPTTNDNKGIYVIDGTDVGRVLGYSSDLSAYLWWHLLVVNTTNNSVVQAIPNGESKAGLASTYFTDGNHKFVLAFSGEANRDFYDLITVITPENYSEYQIATVTSTVGAALFVERTISVNEAETKGFGLLMTSDNDYLNNLSATEGIPSSELVNNDPTTNTTNENGICVSNLWDENEKDTPYATQDVHGAKIRTNLVAKELDANGNPRYTKDTVTYLANFMQSLMVIPEKGDNGAYNTYHVMGAKLFDENKEYVGPNSPLAVYDLADIFRENVTDGLGDYDTAKEKFDNRQLLYAHQATTWFEAAYYLLHMLWNDSPVDTRTGTEGQDGYGMPISNYNRLHLVQTTNENGDITYVFNAKYDGTTYDYWNGEIFNSPFGDYTTEDRPFSAAYTKAGATNIEVGGNNILPAARFDPLGPFGAGVDRGYTMAASADTYGDFSLNNNMNWAEYYDETNYHMSLEGHAQFVYHQDANQYFTFTGDDDVYLYVNGIRVLDVGGAHSIAKVSIDLNNVAEYCGLKDGGTYSFDFFFLERHGTAANFGIETNIQIAEPSLTTTKTGYQGGSSTGYNGFVDPDVPVAYSFNVKNDGEAAIQNLIFDDPTINIYFSKDTVTLYPVGEAEADHCYSINDMYLYIFHPNGSVKEVYSQGNLTEQIIMDKMAEGLQAGESIGIYGFKYKIPSGAWVDDTFTNTVTTTGTSATTGKTLRAVANWKVQKGENMNQFHVYDWLAQNISKNPETQINNKWYHPEGYTGVTVTVEEILNILVENNVITEEQRKSASIVQCTASGNEDKYNLHPNVTEELNGTTLVSLTYKSTIPGVDQVYFKVKGVESIASMIYNYRVFTFGAVDNIYVLDYGLPVELNGENFGLLTNDHLNVVGADVNVGVTGIQDDTSNYGVFTYDDDDSSLKYTPNEIIDNTDSVRVNVQVLEEGATAVTRFTGVDMFETVTTAPASVVYYEENFPGITYVETSKFKVDDDGYLLDAEGGFILYQDKKLKIDNDYLLYDDGTNVTYEGKKIKVNDDGTLVCEDGTAVTGISINLVIIPDEDGNQWVHYKTADENGNTVAGNEQSADQDMNYGSDPNYSDDKIGWAEETASSITFKLDTSDPNVFHKTAVDALNEYLGLSDEDSNGTVNKLEVKQTDEVMWFDFVGTGFEILSRTTNDQYAVLSVKVYLMDEDGNVVVNQVDTDGYDDTLPSTNSNGIVRVKPVVTESMGGTVYQVPVISITGLKKANYRVSVTAAAHDDHERILYIDGIRIYGPLSDDEAIEYYNPEEYQAVFYEIKELIGNYQAIFASLYDTEDSPKLGTGSTLIEETTDTGYVLTNLNKDGDEVTLDDYLSYGPNNEIYLNGNAGNMIAFYLIPDEDVPVAERTIQIGAHRKADGAEGYDDAVGMYYSSTADALTVDNITEQPYYHTVASGTEQYFDIDVNNLELGTDGRYLVMIAAGESHGEGMIESLALTSLKLKGYSVVFNNEELSAQNQDGTLDKNRLISNPVESLKALKATSEPDAEEALVNENLEITSAALRAKTLASGKTATLSVKATSEAVTIVVTDAQGNAVEYTRCTPKATSTGVTFTFQWRVTGSRGDVQNYTIRVYDANGLASVNTKTVTINIK